MSFKRRFLMAWMGLALLALNLVAGALMPAASASPLAQAGGAGYICTALGLRAVGPANAQDQQDSRTGAPESCVFCLPLMQGGVDGPAVLAFAETVRTVLPAEFVAVFQPLAQEGASFNAASPRAPPSSFEI